MVKFLNASIRQVPMFTLGTSLHLNGGTKLTMKFDPITVEILWRRLISVVDEADSSVARTAFSSLLRDAHDYTCMFTDRKGRELAQGTFATPGQSGAMALGIKNIVK